MGDSSTLRLGQRLVAIGNALGEFRNTVSTGIVSGLSRTIVAGGGGMTEQLSGLIQTDAAINTGNSGGPLLNLRGEVVGINTAVAAGAQNIGFAIPINQAKKTAEQLINTGFSTYPVMGITVDTQFTGSGALISSESAGVIAGGPADKAGLKRGDIIISLDGVEVENSNELIVAIRSKNIGDKVKVKFRRNNITREVDVVLAASKK